MRGCEEVTDDHIHPDPERLVLHALFCFFPSGWSIVSADLTFSLRYSSICEYQQTNKQIYFQCISWTQSSYQPVQS